MAKEAKEEKKVFKKIRVRATRMGYYNHIRQREGSIFVIPENKFSKRWMTKVEAKAPVQIEEETAEDLEPSVAVNDSGEKQISPASTGDEEVI